MLVCSMKERNVKTVAAKTAGAGAGFEVEKRGGRGFEVEKRRVAKGAAQINNSAKYVAGSAEDEQLMPGMVS